MLQPLHGWRAVPFIKIELSLETSPGDMIMKIGVPSSSTDGGQYLSNGALALDLHKFYDREALKLPTVTRMVGDPVSASGSCARGLVECELV